MTLLKNGRPYQALSKECCYKDVDEKISLLTKKVTDLENEKIQLELKLTEAVMKQHDAMKNAVNLAEKNHQLENELMEIDRMALAVESDCNKAVRENNEKMLNLQRQLNDATNKIRELEKQNENHEKEHKKMENKIQCLLDEKQSMLEKINHFDVIEYDLNAEVDRLTKIMVQQKRQIENLESQLEISKTSPIRTERCKKTSIPKFCYRDSKLTSPKQCGLDPNKGCDQSSKTDCCTGCRCKTEDGESIKNCLHTINRLQTERDYYWREYERMRSNWEKNSTNEMNLIEIRRKLNEKEQTIQSLQEDLRDVSRNKHNLEMQLHEIKDADRWMGRVKNINKADIKKLELERDIAMGDCRRLEEERNDLRCRLQMAHDLQQADAKRYEEVIRDLECRLRQLEDERHNMVLETGTRGACISKLEEKLCQYKNDYKAMECELMRMKQCYAQQKALREQAESRISELECTNCQLEKNYQEALCRIKNVETDIECLKTEIMNLTTENQTLQSKVCKLTEENDCFMQRLDNKTEEVECLRDQLRKKDNCLQILEGQQRVLQEQLNDTLDQLQSNQGLIKCMETELNELKCSASAAEKNKDCLFAENRQLQSELSQITGDLQCVNKNYELAQQQIEDLKQQLQGYICEVSRIEDLLDQKEKQRDSMLADFRQLSAEANILENNNSSLENEACVVKHELQNANEKLCELKDALERNECLIKSYCQQIQTLTSNVARLECEIAQITQQRDNAEKLCAKLERQNDELINELAEKEDQKSQWECELKRCKQEYDNLKMQFSDKMDEICQLEDQLCKARDENNYTRMLKDELQNEVNDLNRIVDRLQCKLEECRCNVAKYRTKIIELQDDIVNLTAGHRGHGQVCDSDC
ncbi:putative leucine-rich repeat-containing protein DDB_G0290503 isoform X2 [Chrysoperla carnea]|nr:putative leucine-rich repeat-containing protein DDB_G0290503 isoform X2 [Chrysoperla carnea]